MTDTHMHTTAPKQAETCYISETASPALPLAAPSALLLPGLGSGGWGSRRAVALSPLHPRWLHPAPITNIKSRSSHFPFLGPFSQASGVKTPKGEGVRGWCPGPLSACRAGAHNGGSRASSPFRNSCPCSTGRGTTTGPQFRKRAWLMPLLDPGSRTAYPAPLRPWPRGCSVGTGTEVMESQAGPGPDFLLRLPPASASPRPMADHAHTLSP